MPEGILKHYKDPSIEPEARYYLERCINYHEASVMVVDFGNAAIPRPNDVTQVYRYAIMPTRELASLAKKGALSAGAPRAIEVEVDFSALTAVAFNAVPASP